jgi:hypothetical protein
VAGLLDQIAGLADTPQKRAALAALVGELERNPAHPPERFNRGVRNVAGGMAKAIGEGIAFPRKYMETYQPGSMAADNPAATEWAAGTAMNMVGAPALTGGVPGMGAGIRAYHGSPHDFDRFDMSKIGTGEGAQAYGHGLYFAENPKVAEEYKSRLASNKVTLPADFISSQKADDLRGAGFGDKAIFMANQFLRDSRGDVGAALKGLGDIHLTNGSQAAKDAADVIRAFSPQFKHERGRMYEVNINAAPEQFLSSDLNLNKQSPAVKEALWKSGIYQEGPYRSGALAYQDLADRGTVGQGLGERQAAASAALREAGIPGIKYLDQGSRQVSGGELIDVFKGPQGWQSKIRMNRPNGEQYFTTSAPHQTEDAARSWAMGKIQTPGTNNYVVFDDKLIEILRKYGLAGLAAMPALANAPQLEQAQ